MTKHASSLQPRTRRLLPSARLATAATLTTLLLSASQAGAWAGITCGNSAPACGDVEVTPQRFARHHQGLITYRMTDGFKTYYPDAFSQFLIGDTLRLWVKYMNAQYSWSDDIESRFSYYRPGNGAHEFKSVLLHEYGHTLGMQHSDACYYNGDPQYFLNHRSNGNGTASVAATIGPELMNEGWIESSPGQKGPMGAQGYNRTPGRDDWEWANYAYPFQSFSVSQVNANATISVTSTNGGPSGGQAGPDSCVEIGNDNTDGWWIEEASMWLGNSIGLQTRSQTYQIENYTGSDINQITLRAEGTSSSRAMITIGGGYFPSYGTIETSSPEEITHLFTADWGNLFPSGDSTEITMQLDVHDWTLTEGMMWFTANQAWPIPFPDVIPFMPWAAPDSPAPKFEPGYVVPPGFPTDSFVPTNIELIPREPHAPQGARAFDLLLPAMDDLEVERVELIPISWTRAEMLMRINDGVRNRKLGQRFDDSAGRVVDLMRTSTERDDERRTSRSPGKQVSRFPVTLGDDVTYAARVVVSNSHARVTTIVLPEMTQYLGTKQARCAQGGDALSCCPVGSRIIEGTSRDDRLVADASATSCVVGNAGDDIVNLWSAQPHTAATGDGADRVYNFGMGSNATLGRGNDTLVTASWAPIYAEGGDGRDNLSGSDEHDNLSGGNGNDVLSARGGDDSVDGGAGNDWLFAGEGDDEIRTGSGFDVVNAGRGDDRVVIGHACELGRKVLFGGPGEDTLVLPGTLADAQRTGLVAFGFETVIEDSPNLERFSDCEFDVGTSSRPVPEGDDPSRR
jgi:hypothetical protein